MHIFIRVVLVALVSIQVSEEATPRQRGREQQNLEAGRRQHVRWNDPYMYTSLNSYNRAAPYIHQNIEGQRDLESTRFKHAMIGRAPKPVIFGGYKRAAPYIHQNIEGQRDLESTRFQHAMIGRAPKPVIFGGYKRVRNHSE